jgi:hypothetical protein
MFMQKVTVINKSKTMCPLGPEIGTFVQNGDKQNHKMQTDGNNQGPVRLAYQPPASSTFLSQQTSHQQPASSTLLSEQTSTGHQPPANRTGCKFVVDRFTWSIL